MTLAGELGVSTDTIGRLAPVELAAYVEGYRRRTKEQVRLVAWQVATMINLWGSSPVTVGQLLGEEHEGPDEGAYDVAAEVQRAREMREAKEQAEAEGWDHAATLDEDAMESRLRALEEVEP